MSKISVIFFSYPLRVDSVPNAQLFPEPPIFQNDTTINLLSSSSERIDKIALSKEIERIKIFGENIVYLCPTIVRERFEEFKLFNEQFVQKSLTEEQEDMLKRLASKEIGLDVFKEMIFDEVVEYEFTPKEQDRNEEPLANDIKLLLSKHLKISTEKVTYDQVNNFIQKSHITYSRWKKVAITAIAVSLLVMSGSVIWVREQQKRLNTAFEMGINEIEIADEWSTNISKPDVKKYIKTALDEMEAAEEYSVEKEENERCEITVNERDTLSKYGIKKENNLAGLSIKESPAVEITLIAGKEITLLKKECPKKDD